MNIESIEKLMEISIMDSIADLKNGKKIDVQFYLFFHDGYCKLPHIKLPKEARYGVVNILLNHFKPEAFSTISDCFVRDAEGNLTHEQLLSLVVGKNGESRMHARSYDRSSTGEICMREKEQEQEIDYVGGMLPRLYNHSPFILPEAYEKMIIDSFGKVIDDEKIIYSQSPFAVTASKTHIKDEQEHGITFH